MDARLTALCLLGVCFFKGGGFICFVISIESVPKGPAVGHVIYRPILSSSLRPNPNHTQHMSSHWARKKRTLRMEEWEHGIVQTEEKAERNAK